ncbi:glycosyl hydrolase family 8 [Anaerosporobacter sp.]
MKVNNRRKSSRICAIIILISMVTSIVVPNNSLRFSDETGKLIDYKVASEVSAAGVIHYPFPQHVTYTKGTITPSVKQSKKDKVTKEFYDLWKKKYIVKNPYATGKAQYYVWSSGQKYNKQNNQTVPISVSESQGYGMLITVYMAGYDKSAKKLFDGMYRYYKANTCERGKYLMSWQQGDNGKKIVDLGGGSSATDGDLDIAYALLLADKQWGSSGSINYKKAAVNIINDIMKYEVNKKNNTIQLGNWASTLDKNHVQYTGLRSSDLMPQHFKSFAKVTGNKTWNSIVTKSYTILNQLTVKSSRKTGLVPDFIVKDNTKYSPANAYFLEGAKDGSYGYNACRVPFRIGVDYLTTGSKKGKDMISLLNTWIRKETGNKPENIRSGYTLNGSAIESYYDMSYVAPLLISAMCQSSSKGAQNWVNSLWKMVAESGTNNYYNDTIKLLCLIIASGNWWTA